LNPSRSLDMLGTSFR